MTDITIVNGDFRDAPAALWASCDALITDPPYSAYVHSHASSMSTVGVGPHARDLGFDHATEAVMVDTAKVAAAVRRWSVVFCDVESTHLWRDQMHTAGLEYIREVPATYADDDHVDWIPSRWIRWSQPQLSGDRPPTGCEAVLHFHVQPTGAKRPRPMRKHWNGPGGLTHYGHRSLRGSDKHPTEKPLDLMLSLVSYFSDPGETVVDPFAGRGTTAMACMLLGRHCYGFELQSRWADAAAARCDLGTIAKSPDLARAIEWATHEIADAQRVPEPRDPKMQAAYDRAQRRLADARRVAETCGGPHEAHK